MGTFSFDHQKRIYPFMLVFCEAIIYLSNDMYCPGLPAIAQDFGVTQDMSQATLLIWFLGSGSMQLFVGPLADRYGRKITLMGGMGLFLISTLLCALTSDFYYLMIGRFLQGASACFVMVAGYATIHALYHHKKAIQIISLLVSIILFAPAFGPFLGGLVIEVSHWRTTFWILEGCALLGVIGMIFLMPPLPKERETLSFSSVFKEYCFIVKNPFFMLLTIAYSLILIVFFIWILESPFIFIETYGKSPLYFGVAQIAVFSGSILGGQLANRWIDRKEAHTLVQSGLGIALGGGLSLLSLSFLDSSVPVMIGCMTVTTFGTSLLLGPLNRLIVESSDRPMGIRIAVFTFTIMFFGCLSSLLVTLINDRTFLNMAWFIVASMSVAAGLYNYTRSKILETEKR